MESLPTDTVYPIGAITTQQHIVIPSQHTLHSVVYVGSFRITTSITNYVARPRSTPPSNVQMTNQLLSFKQKCKLNHWMYRKWGGQQRIAPRVQRQTESPTTLLCDASDEYNSLTTSIRNRLPFFNWLTFPFGYVNLNTVTLSERLRQISTT